MNEKECSTSLSGPRKTYCHRRRGKLMPSGLEALNLNAAGIDVGSQEHYVSVPEDRDQESIRRFGCTTPELERMAKWLLACAVDTVALESTGVYWVPVFRVLEKRGLKVLLVDARHVKYVPGRKTDVADCLWLRQLHTFGLLRGAFVPAQEVVAMRTYWRQRKELVESAARAIQHMQKALTQMNLHLHVVLSDIAGVSGLRMLRAMVEGERDPAILARLAHASVKSPEAEIVAALTGHYSDEQIFVLTQSLARFDFYQSQIAQCDARLQDYLARYPVKKLPAPSSSSAAPQAKPSRQKRRKNEPHFDLGGELVRLSGVDLTRIDGISAMTAFAVYSEIGFDLSAFPSVKQFASWLGLCPNNQITGGQVKRRRTKRTKNRVADALRVAAQSLHRSQSYLGAYYRHMRTRLGAPKAITATAHKLARLIYFMLAYGQDYVDAGHEQLEAQHRTRRVKSLMRHARELGYEVLDPHTGELFAQAG